MRFFMKLPRESYYKTLFSLVFGAALLAGCGGGTASGVPAHFEPVEASYSLTEPNSLVSVKNTSDATLHVDLGTSPKSLFVVTTSYADNQFISINNTQSQRVSRSKAVPTSDSNSNLQSRILSFNENTFKLLRNRTYNTRQNSNKEFRSNDVSEGVSETFCVDMDSGYNCTRYVDATAVRVAREVTTAQGRKTLVVWLENGVQINTKALDNIGNIFLQPGLNNDIYDWETNIYSKEWGADAQRVDGNLIGDDATINILVYNISNSRLAGFFWPKDTFKRSYLSASNEKIMFYVNAQLLASDEKETFTTLGHEFQHMIHFYQRAVLKDLHDSTWFNEMMSEATEDILATKIGYKGPRNVDPNDGTAGDSNNKKGRYPSFNANNRLSLTRWESGVAHYGKVSAFGTFLLRNYGGAELLHKLMVSNSYDTKDLLESTGQSDIHTLVNQWGAAVLFSDKTSVAPKLRYNIGDFFYTEYNGVDYQLGSINFFNYTPKPSLQKSATINDNANLYTKIGDNLTGKIDIKVNAPKGAIITVIAKDKH